MPTDVPRIHSRRSGILFGVGDDAAYLAAHIAAREVAKAKITAPKIGFEFVEMGAGI